MNSDKYIISVLLIVLNMPISIFSINIENNAALTEPFIIIRLIGSLSSILFLLHELCIPKPHLKRYWDAIMLYNFIITPFYSLINYKFILVWFVNYILSLFIYFSFYRINEKKINVITSMIITLIFYYIVYNFEQTTFNYNYNLPFYCLISNIIIIITLIFYRSHINKIEIYNLELFSRSVAHETLDPLSFIVMKSEHMLNKLDIDNNFDGDFYYDFKRDIHDIKTYADRGIRDTKIFLTSMKDINNINDYGTYSASKSVEMAVLNYSLPLNQMERITINVIKDFEFYGSKELFKHLILNLLKNSLKHGGMKCQINIEINNRDIVFMDNGRGIKPEIMEFIFNKYYSGSISGTGVGLNFCKAVMDKMEGDINCESEYGEYTKFILKFP